MPLMPEYKLNSMRLYIKDLKSVDLKVIMAGGLLPAIQIDNADVEDLKIALSHEMEIAGVKTSPNVVLSESTFQETEEPALAIPFKNPTHFNGLSTTLKTGRTTVIFPNLFATVVMTFLPLFIVILVLLVLLWVWVKIRGDSKEDEDIQDEVAKEEPDRRDYEKKRWSRGKKIFAVVVLLIILGGVIYYAFIPRAELKVRTDFLETPSGIFVVCEASNAGTVMIEDMNVTLNVYNTTDELMNGTSFSVNVLKRGDFIDKHVHFFGDQFESYLIHITVNFKSYGNKYQKTLTYSAGEHMRMSFEDSIS
jgi:hypothetical protein